MAMQMTMTGRAVHSKPTAMPAMMFVAGPVCEASAMESTGRYLYSV